MSNDSKPADFPSALQQAGLDNKRFTSETIEIEELGAATVLKIHSRAGNAQPASTPPGLRWELPLDTGAARGEDPAALCLAPGEWLLVSTRRAPGELLADLGVPQEPLSTALLDLSDACAVFRLSGPAPGGSGGPG